MVRDRIIQLIGLPGLGLSFTLSVDLFAFPDFSARDFAFATLVFLPASFLIWQGSRVIMHAVRSKLLQKAVVFKMFSISAFVALYSILLSSCTLLVWSEYFGLGIGLSDFVITGIITAAIMIIIALVREIITMEKERRIDSQVVLELDKELEQAEMNVLRNELDPHFVYNSLMPLYYLVKNDTQKAEAFACKLIQVYQYFLQNRQNDYITVDEELKFIENYFFLLQIRYKDAIKLSVQVDRSKKLYVLPLSLQILVENAIKHNALDAGNPLLIQIRSENTHLAVINSLRDNPSEMVSSKIGLRNLRKRYRILTGSDISVLKSKEEFIVKIPLINKARTYDVNRYNRG